MTERIVNVLATVDDYRWLIGETGGRWLRRVADNPQPLVRRAALLRKELSATQAHLVLQQVELRRRARAKFSEAERMFFTPVGLEQATDQSLAAYKAARFPEGGRIGDLCCGIGGDLLALVPRGDVVGVDRDPVTALLAEANLHVLHSTGSQPLAKVRAADVTELALREFAAWHIDPDRRAQGRRTTRVELHEPGAPALDRMLRELPHAAVKLAPAAELPQRWEEEAELEWISRARECRQLVAWFGSLAQQPGHRRATVLADDAPGQLRGVRTLVGRPCGSLPVAPRVGRYIFDPDPAVLAAHLVAVVADEHALAAVAPDIPYLTGDTPVADLALSAFEVTDVLPFDRKRLKRLLEFRRIGRLEIKKRGVPDDPQQLRRQLRLRGEQPGVVLLAPIAGSVIAILARRLARESDNDSRYIHW